MDDAVRRICLEQFDKAANDVSGSEVDIREGVHQARKRFTKIGAVLRLVQSALAMTGGQDHEVAAPSAVVP